MPLIHKSEILVPPSYWCQLPPLESVVSWDKGLADAKVTQQLALAIADSVLSSMRVDHHEICDLNAVAGLCRRASDGAIGVIEPADIVRLRGQLRQTMERLAPTVNLFELLNCRTVEETIQRLHEIGRCLGFKNIRYYPLLNNRTAGCSLLSYASAGHDQKTVELLRAGQIIRFLAHSPLMDFDSFWSLALAVPTLFVIEDRNTTGVECYFAPDAVPFIRVDQNHCKTILERVSANPWVDFPLGAGSETPMGKLSCDLELPLEIQEDSAGRLEQHLSDAILKFAAVVQLVTARLEVLYRQELQRGLPPVSEVGAEIQDECNTPEQAAAFVVEKIPQILKCRYGSVLTSMTDSCGAKLLVLERTSYPASRSLEKRGTYHWSESALTAWVARTGTSVCLQDLGDRELLHKKLKEYDPELVWANKIPDSDNHGDLLIVPVWHKNQVVAVLRYTSRVEGHFTECEQRWLEQFARQYLGPKLDCSRRQRSEQLRDDLTEATAAISIRDAVTTDETAKELAERFGVVVRQIFASSQGRKTILVNVKDGDEFSHRAIMNDIDGAACERYWLPGSLTGFALQQPGIVFLGDLPLAESQGRYRAVFREAVCALACRMGPISDPLGAIVVLSDKYDISADVHGPALKLLADRAGEIFWRRKVATALLGKRPRATVLAALVRELDGALRSPGSSRTGTANLRRILSLLRSMLDIVDGEGPTCDRFSADFEEFVVRDAVDSALSLARSEISDSEKVHVHCEIDPRLKVVAQQGFFVAILFDVLRHAWQFSSQVLVEATSPRRGEGGAQWLDIIVRCGQPWHQNPLPGLGYQDAMLESLQLQPELLELPVPYQLARAYQLSDGRRGNLQLSRNDESSYCCAFQLPIASQAPQPSEC